MILSANIFADAAFAVGGAAICFLFLWRRNRNLDKAKSVEAGTILDKAREDARLKAAKLREETEQSFTARRTELIEMERRLSEREALINSQLGRIVETEKGFKEQQETLRATRKNLESKERELDELTKRRHEQLQKLADLTEAEAREIFL